MKNIFLLILLYLIWLSVIAQVPATKKWDFRYGGDILETPSTFVKTMDDGYIIGGASNSSTSFDKTDTCRGSNDYWIVKTDSNGNKLWDKTFGGNDIDYLQSIIALPDSGFLLGGYSLSGMNGDKSQPSFGIGSNPDFWIIRIDKNGNKIWDKAFGGIDYDYLYSMLLMPDGTYLIGGETNSDSTGSMSHHSYSNFDYWILKIDSNGNKIWDYNYGGSEDDDLLAMCMTNDHGYILGGKSTSPADGCKSQPGINATMDYWFLKIDSNGVQQWDRRAGGISQDILHTLICLPNNNVLIGGISYSPIGYEKTIQNHGSINSDFWILCVDSSGNILWDKTYGGNNNEDEICNMSIIQNGVLITGTSYSSISGDKSEANILNAEQPWVIAIDTAGNKIWDKTFNVNTHIEFCYGSKSKDGCYEFLSHAENGGGDVSQFRSSLQDYWFFKFCPDNLLYADYSCSTTTFCQNTCMDFTNLSSNANTYDWIFPGGTPSTSTDIAPHGICYLTSGTFDVTLIAHGASGSDTLTLPQFLTVYPQVPFTPILQTGDTISSIAGYLSYQWYNDTLPINGANNYFYVAQHNGDYSVVVTDSNGCSATAQLINVIASTNENITSEENFNVNYNYGNIYLNFTKPLEISSTIQINDAMGNEIYKENISSKSGRKSYEVSDLHLSDGIYFISIINYDQCESCKLFIH